MRILFLFLFSISAFAGNPRAACSEYKIFHVYIKNNTPYDCVFSKQILRRGYLEDFNPSLSLKPYEEKKIISIRDFNFQGSDIVLSYQCSDHHFVTIESEHDTWAMDSKYIKGYIWNTYGIHPSFTSIDGNCKENNPAQITWTFEE